MPSSRQRWTSGRMRWSGPNAAEAPDCSASGATTHDLTVGAQRMGEMPQPDRIDAVIVGDEDPDHGPDRTGCAAGSAARCGAALPRATIPRSVSSVRFTS